MKDYSQISFGASRLTEENEMNELRDNLLDIEKGYSSVIFDMDFSEYFLPNEREAQTNLRVSTRSALDWMEAIEKGDRYGLANSMMRHEQLRTHAEAIGMMLLVAFRDNTDHGEDGEDNE